MLEILFIIVFLISFIAWIKYMDKNITETMKLSIEIENASNKLNCVNKEMERTICAIDSEVKNNATE